MHHTHDLCVADGMLGCGIEIATFSDTFFSTQHVHADGACHTIVRWVLHSVLRTGLTCVILEHVNIIITVHHIIALPHLHELLTPSTSM